MTQTDLFRGNPMGRILDAHPINAVDVGARGGFDADLKPIAWGVNAVGFEPNPEEFARLRNADPKPWRSVQLLGVGVSADGGTQTLRVPADPQAASLYPSNVDVCGPFDKRQFFDTVEEIEVTTEPMADALSAAGRADVDYLKIDIEGPELDVMRACPDLIAGMVAAKIEVSFLQLRGDQGIAADVHLFMRDHGFQLIDLMGEHRWRDRGYVIHPHLDNGAVPYSRGQLIQGDYLFFKDLAALDLDTDAGRVAAAKAALLAMSFGFFDIAGRFLGAPGMRDFLADMGIDNTGAALGDASRAYGRAAFKAAFGRQIRTLATFLRRAL